MRLENECEADMVQLSSFDRLNIVSISEETFLHDFKMWHRFVEKRNLS